MALTMRRSGRVRAQKRSPLVVMFLLLVLLVVAVVAGSQPRPQEGRRRNPEVARAFPSVAGSQSPHPDAPSPSPPSTPGGDPAVSPAGSATPAAARAVSSATAVAGLAATPSSRVPGPSLPPPSRRAASENRSGLPVAPVRRVPVPVSSAVKADPRDVEPVEIVAPRGALTDTPLPQASPAAHGIPVVPGRITLVGRMALPSAEGVTGPVGGQEIRLVRLASADILVARTDAEGGFRFVGLDPQGFYYLVAHNVNRRDLGLGYDYQWGWDGAKGRYGYVMVQVRRIEDERRSWHLAIAPVREGAWAVEMGEDNADAEYCADIRPTHDPILRTPYRSWRQADLVHLLGDPASSVRRRAR